MAVETYKRLVNSAVAMSETFTLCRKKSCCCVTTSSMRRASEFSDSQAGRFSDMEASYAFSCTKLSIVNVCLKLMKPRIYSNEEKVSDGMAVVQGESSKR